METVFNILGIDVGSVSVSVAAVDSGGTFFLKNAVVHRGEH